MILPIPNQEILQIIIYKIDRFNLLLRRGIQMNKKLAITLYFIWGIALTLLLTFGKSLSFTLIYKLSRAASKIEIEDVVLDIDLNDSYMITENICPVYTAIGNFTKDAGLCFESLDSETLIVRADGSFCGVRTDAEETTGRIRITSEYDIDFEKIITLKFKKVYPSEFEPRYAVKSYGCLTDEVYMGIPINTYVAISGSIYCSERQNFTVTYDTEYFEMQPDGTLIAIKETPSGVSTSLKYTYKNGQSCDTKSFRIVSAPDGITEFDSIRLSGRDINKGEFCVNAPLFISIYTNDKKVITNYTVTSSDPSCFGIDESGSFYLKRAGTHDITVTLPNGFSKTFEIMAVNILSMPELDGLPLENGGIVVMKNTDTLRVLTTFDKNAYAALEFDYDSNMLTITSTSQSFTLIPEGVGDTSFTIILDDGCRRVEKTYLVRIERDTDFLSLVKEYATVIVAKSGHLAVFAILAFFAVNMLRFAPLNRKYIYPAFLTLSGLSFASLTELLQAFMPGRASSISDIIVDMAGYLIGALVSLLFFRILHASKKKAVRPPVLRCADEIVKKQPAQHKPEEAAAHNERSDINASPSEG